MRPEQSVQLMLDLDEAGDKRWLDWLEACQEKLRQKREDAHTLEVVRQAKLKLRASNIQFHIQNIDEVNYEDILP